MKRLSLLAVSAAALITIAGCEAAPPGIDLIKQGGATVQVLGEAGARPYDGGAVPRAEASGAASLHFKMTFGAVGYSYPYRPVLIIGPSSWPYRLSMNGRLLSGYGQPGDRDRMRNFSSVMVELPDGLMLRDNVIEVDAFTGGSSSPLPELRIADSGSGSSYVFWRNFFMIQFMSGGFVLGFVLLAYFLFVYFLDRERRQRFLWFAIFCGAFAISCVNIVFNNPTISETLLTKASRIGFLVLAPALVFYVMETTGLFAKLRAFKVVEGLLAAAGAIWLVSRRDFPETNAVFHTFINFFITPNLILALGLIAVGIARQGLRPFVILLLGLAGAIGASLYDMGFEMSGVMPYAWTLSYGYEWLVICVFLELAVGQEVVSRAARRQSETLREKNEILERVFGHLRQDSGTLAALSEEIAVSTKEISGTGSQQAVAVREIVATMEDARALLGRVSQRSSMVERDSRATAQKAGEGEADVREALEKLEAVIGRMSESISLIADFDEHLGSIKEIVKLIEGIASQIRIIAFNASLEAVAAGEAGGNFAIVADEVKRLADSTMASVKNIREKVASLIAMSDNVVKVSRDGYSSLEKSWDIASGMGDSFAEIVSSAESSALATADIDASLGEEARAFDQIVQTLREISAGVDNFVDAASHNSETTNSLNGVVERLHALVLEYSQSSGDGKKVD